VDALHARGRAPLMKCQMIAITAMSENIEDAKYRPGVVGRLLDKTRPC